MTQASQPDLIAGISPSGVVQPSLVVPRLVAITLATFLGCGALALPLATVPIEVHALGFGAVTIGWVMGLQSLATLVTRQLAGGISDRRGGKLAVVIGTLMNALAGLSYLGSAFLPASAALAILIVGRLFLGFGESLLITGALAWAVRALGPAHTGRAMVWIGIAMYGALAVGAPIGSLIFNSFGFIAIALCAIAVPLAAVLIAVRLAPLPAVRGKRLPFIAVIGFVWKPGLGLSLCTVGFAAIYSFLGLDFALKGWSGAAYGISAFGIAFILARLFFGHLPDRFGGARFALFTLPVQASGQFILWSAPNAFIACLGAALTGAGYSLTFPAFGLEAVRRVPPQDRGAAMGAYMAFLDIGLGLSGPVTGAVVGAFGFPSGFLFGVLTSLASLALAVRMSVRARHSA